MKKNNIVKIDGLKYSTSPLNADTIKEGILIASIANPEWGTWPVSSHYSEGIWEIGRGCNGMCLFDSEFHFWHIVTRVK